MPVHTKFLLAFISSLSSPSFSYFSLHQLPTLPPLSNLKGLSYIYIHTLYISLPDSPHQPSTYTSGTTSNRYRTRILSIVLSSAVTVIQVSSSLFPKPFVSKTAISSPQSKHLGRIKTRKNRQVSSGESINQAPSSINIGHALKHYRKPTVWIERHQSICGKYAVTKTPWLEVFVHRMNGSPT